jgi:integrase
MHVRIYKRENSPYWYVSYSYNGKRHRYSLGVTDKRNARLKAGVIEKELALGIDPVRKPYKQEPLPDLFERYLNYCKGRNAPPTLSDKKRHVRNFSKYFVPPVEDITKADVEGFITERLKTASNPTINRELTTLKHFLNFLIDLGYLEKNPANGVKKLPEKPKPIRLLTDDELDRWFEWTQKNDLLLYDLSVIAFNTGLRRSDVLKIKGEDINVAKRTLAVNISKLHGAELYIPLNETAYKVLSRRKKPGYIFPSQVSDHLTDFYKRFRRARAAVGLNDFQFREFRHNCATRLLELGTDINTVKEILGHSEITTTARYLKVIEDKKRRALEALGRK